MSDIFYVGDTINLAFKITIDTSLHLGEFTPPKITTGGSAGVKLVAISVTVYNEEGEIVHEDPVLVIDNVVKYTLAPELTKHAGDYAAFFDMIFVEEQKETYTMRFAVLPRGIQKEEEKLPVNRLTEDSSDAMIEQALGSSMRSLRKRGKKASAAYNIAQEKLQRRLKK